MLGVLNNSTCETLGPFLDLEQLAASPLGSWGLSTYWHKRLHPADGAEETTWLVQRAERRIQQSAVERKQGTFRHLGRCWPSTASLLISSRLDFVLPLDLDGPGRESEADDHAQLSLTLIQPMRKSSSSTSSFPSPPPPPPNHQLLQAMWLWASDEAAGVDTLGAVDADLHTGGSGHMVVFHLNRGKSEIRQPPARPSSPFYDRTAHLHSMSSLPQGINDRIMTMKLTLTGKKQATIISAYAPTMNQARPYKGPVLWRT